MYIKQVIENRESWWGYILTVILIVPIVNQRLGIIFSIKDTDKPFISNVSNHNLVSYNAI